MVQPVPKQMTRGQKEDKVEELANDINEYNVIGLLDMHSLPAKQLQDLKKEMKDFAKTRMTRKTLMKLALEKADKNGVEELDLDSATQPAFIFSEKDPFQLYSLIQANKTSAAAQGGEEAPDDIEVDDGDTGIGPGPMLGKLQQRGLNVQVEEGSIHVQSPGVIIEEGEEITSEDAEILSQLGIEPLEIGLDLQLAFASGEIFTADELDIDIDEYREQVEAAASGAFNLAVNAGHVTETTAPAIISEAVTEARNLSTSEGLPEEETIEDSISYAASNAEGVDSQIEPGSVDTEEEEAEQEEDTEEHEDEEEAGEDDSSKESDQDEGAEEQEEEEEDADAEDGDEDGTEDSAAKEEEEEEETEEEAEGSSEEEK